MKKLILVFFVLAALFTLSAFAEGEPEISADFAGVYNIETGDMLYSKNSNTIIYPASLVKIMTATLALEYYSNKSDYEITVTETALQTLKGNNIKLKVGEKASFYDLIAAVAVGGANDAALVVAENVAGSVDAFVKMMNDKAEEIGAKNTHFDNPTGYHSPKMYSTVEDLAKISAWAYKNKAFVELSSMVDFKMKATNMSKERTFTNANLLLDPNHWLRHYLAGTKGMNVGSTAEAGYTLSTVYDNNGQTNVVILVGGKAEGWDYYYFDDAKALIEYTSVSYEYRDLVPKDKPVADIEIEYGRDSDHILLTTKNGITALLPEEASDEDITTDFVVTRDNFVAPVKKGEEWGTLTAYYKGKVVGSTPIVTQNNIKRDYFLYISGGISRFFKLHTVKGVIYLILSSLFLAVTIAAVAYYYRRKRALERQRQEKLRRLNRARRNL